MDTALLYISENQKRSVYTMYSNLKYKKYKLQYPRLRESEIIAKVIREWNAKSYDQVRNLRDHYLEVYGPKFLQKNYDYQHNEVYSSDQQIIDDCLIPFVGQTNKKLKQQSIIVDEKKLYEIKEYIANQNFLKQHGFSSQAHREWLRNKEDLIQQVCLGEQKIEVVDQEEKKQKGEQEKKQKMEQEMDEMKGKQILAQVEQKNCVEILQDDDEFIMQQLVLPEPKLKIKKPKLPQYKIVVQNPIVHQAKIKKRQCEIQVWKQNEKTKMMRQIKQMRIKNKFQSRQRIMSGLKPFEYMAEQIKLIKQNFQIQQCQQEREIQKREEENQIEEKKQRRKTKKNHYNYDEFDFDLKKYGEELHEKMKKKRKIRKQKQKLRDQSKMVEGCVRWKNYRYLCQCNKVLNNFQAAKAHRLAEHKFKDDLKQLDQATTAIRRSLRAAKALKSIQQLDIPKQLL